MQPPSHNSPSPDRPNGAHRSPALLVRDDVFAADDPPEAYDALADLFLGEIAPMAGPKGGGEHPAEAPGAHAARSPSRAPVRERRPAARSLPPVECLMLGHLPVLGAAWAAQYGRCIADAEGGPIAFVQARDGRLSVELMTPSDAEPSADDGFNGAQASTFAAAVRLAMRAGVRRWLLRVDETDEPGAAMHPAVGTLTLLTSADEMAVVAAYRTLKRLLPDREAERPRPGGPASPSLRISVMGSPDAAADAAFAKLAEAARTFLGRPVTRAPGVHRLSSKRTAGAIFDAAVQDGAATALDHLARLPDAYAADEPATHEQPIEETAEAISGPVFRLAPPRSSTPAPARPERAPAEIDERPAPSRPRPADEGSPRPLARHVAGLAPLGTLCPYAPAAEFAMDAGARMHILVLDNAGGEGRPAMETLAAAAAWADAHRTLLDAFVQQHRAGDGAPRPLSPEPPALHILAPDPAPLRRLADSGVRLHILAPVQAGPHAVWFCRPVS